jgi:cell division protein FtsN
MTQDFAKIRPEPLLEKKPASNPPAWSLMITGVVLGITIGVFACVLLYLSGRVPPLSQPAVATAELANRASADSAPGTPAESDPAETPLEYEFYRELQEYEVLVDATPVDLSAQDPNRRLERDYLLQTGAFERRELAETEQQRQAALGLNVVVKDPGIVGRSLFLVQSGPYRTQGELDNAETVLRRNSIPFLRLTSQSD